MTSIERTAYPRFKRLITAHELYLFFSPTRDELQWAADATDGDEHLLALLLMLKSYQRMGCFPALEGVPEQVVEFVRRQVELPEGTLPLYRAERTAKHHRGLVRKKVGVSTTRARPGGSPSGRSARRPRRRTGPRISSTSRWRRWWRPGWSCRGSPPSTRWPRRSAPR
ncbi:DUF4158 domain-containing protein [Streptomyces platensis]|uniref:DUF4158 domain-containing protein n=1 Tax=Streptomyces platensis TaxID=58346 RepID=UPI002E808539|nr:DUF4158 domain-containing protein [Streptomyces platensis]WUB78231.1 DUF4158 domain-containing protein [Streptomyces platensis]